MRLITLLIIISCLVMTGCREQSVNPVPSTSPANFGEGETDGGEYSGGGGGMRGGGMGFGGNPREGRNKDRPQRPELEE